jgi:hypothetical protein
LASCLAFATRILSMRRVSLVVMTYIVNRDVRHCQEGLVTGKGLWGLDIYPVALRPQAPQAGKLQFIP